MWNTYSFKGHVTRCNFSCNKLQQRNFTVKIFKLEKYASLSVFSQRIRYKSNSICYFYYLFISISFFTYLFGYMTSLHLANQSRLTASCWLADLIMSRSNKDESWWELAVTNCHRGHFRPLTDKTNVRWLFQLCFNVDTRHNRKDQKQLTKETWLPTLTHSHPRLIRGFQTSILRLSNSKYSQYDCSP
jgi:hypothetical protein